MPVHQAETIEEAIERHIAQVGGKYGSDGAMVGCVRLSSIEQISNMVYALYSAFEKKEVDDKGRPLSRRFFSESGRKPLKTSELARRVVW